MSLFTPADEAELAQEIVATTLAGALHAHGSQKTLAQRAGITPVFVNNIIKRKRMPSPTMARRIAPLLPLPGAEQAAWLDHVERYWTARRQAAYAACAAVQQDAAAVVRELVACRLATFTGDPLAVRRNWARAIQLGEAIEPHLRRREHASLYLDFSDVMVEAYSMLGRHVEALGIARRKQHVVNLMEALPHALGLRTCHKKFEEDKVNARRMQVVAMNELGLYREAYELSLAIEADPFYARNANFWAPLLTWDRLKAMERLPRVGVHEARRMVHAAWHGCDRRTDEWQPLCHMLLGRAYANFCISRGNLKEARAALSCYLPTLDQIAHCGVLHKTLFLRTWARMLRAQGEWDTWRATVSEAVALAQQAGLANEVAAIRREHGDALAPEA